LPTQVLINQEQRDLYNKFGPEGLNKNFVDANALLLQIAIYYLTWGMLVYILTLGKSSCEARNWIFTGQIVMLIVEVSLMLQEVKLPDWFLPTVTEHEIVLLLHSLFPAFMNGCRSIGSFYYQDVDELMRASIASLRTSQAVCRYFYVSCSCALINKKMNIYDTQNSMPLPGNS
jgi:hypothetical protein